MSGDRHSVAEQLDLITDPEDRARREAENGVRQYAIALDVIRTHVHDADRPFRLRSSLILRLHKEVLDGIHVLAGTFRNTPVKIGGSGHEPVEAFMVSEETEHLCQYVNDNWSTKSALHLAAYVLWRLNWIHPFADGNGRTARTVTSKPSPPRTEMPARPMRYSSLYSAILASTAQAARSKGPLQWRRLRRCNSSRSLPRISKPVNLRRTKNGCGT
jgi:hypothetical protein